MSKFNRHEITIFVRMPPINHDFKNLKSHKFHFCNHFSIILSAVNPAIAFLNKTDHILNCDHPSQFVKANFIAIFAL